MTVHSQMPGYCAGNLRPPQKKPISRLIESWRPLLLLLVMGLFCGLIYWWAADNAAGNYRWQWYRVWRYLGSWNSQGEFVAGPLAYGLGLTLQLVAAGLALALLIGAGVAAMRLFASPVARFVASVFLGVVRNTPLLMQLFVVYFVVAPVFGAGQFTAACLSLGVFEGCYISEIFRAGITSLPKSQWEASLGLGMSTWQTMRFVILPQALRNIIAPMTSQIISLIKDTSLVSAIAVADLTMRARVVIADTFMSFEIWLLTAAIYLFLTLVISIPAKLLERKSI